MMASSEDIEKQHADDVSHTSAGTISLEGGDDSVAAAAAAAKKEDAPMTNNKKCIIAAVLFLILIAVVIPLLVAVSGYSGYLAGYSCSSGGNHHDDNTNNTLPDSDDNSYCLKPNLKVLTEDKDLPLPFGSMKVNTDYENTSQATFNITQVWTKTDYIDWIQPVYRNDEMDMLCDPSDRRDNVKGGSRLQYTADCTDGKALVHLLVNDESFNASSQVTNDYGCASWGNNVVAYSFEIACEKDVNLCPSEPERPGEPQVRRWPDLVGLTSGEAKQFFEANHPELNVKIVQVGDPVIMNYRTDRVWLYVDENDMVATVPSIG